jgi:hypothetical protein
VWGCGGVGVGGVGCVGGVGVWGSRPLLTFDIPQTALVATLDTYDFKFFENRAITKKVLLLAKVVGF